MNRFWLGTAVCLLLAIGLLVALIGWGVFDPKPLGVLVWQRSLSEWEITSREVLWLAEVEEAVFTVRGTAVYQSGERDMVAGLVVGNEADYLGVAVSPLGYVMVWQGEEMLMPLQPWPHVHLGSEPNEIWLDVQGSDVTVRLNREILWVGEANVAGGVGVVGQSWGETAVVQFPSIQLYSP